MAKPERSLMIRSALCIAVLSLPVAFSFAQDRPRLQDLGVDIGIFKRGRLNAITDVTGVRVGHVTLIRDDSVRTGITAILPHDGNLFQVKVPAAIFVGNGFGKLIGYTQVEELGLIETPIVLTNTLSVWDAANGVVDYMLSLPGNENVRSINPIVGETNDGFLNDIRGRHVTRSDVVSAIRQAKPGPVEEGCVGAGTGTVCFGWKGGIGTSSRILPGALGGFTVGVLVQTNYGGVLEIAGAPVGKELGRYAFKEALDQSANGSCMIIVAINAPLTAAQLQRLARRPVLALGKTGSAMNHGSGDYVIAFSTSPASEQSRHQSVVLDDQLSPFFQAVIEATEEAIYNSLLRATDMKGRAGKTVEALPIDRVKEILKKFGKIKM
ncbi:MAG: P1 family peptidase [Ignavibacteriales bacterium]|nr:P1 family peptidase [Ignavibacteriales bacterium]